MNKPGNVVVEKLVERQGDAAEVINSNMTARMLPLKVANGASAVIQSLRSRVFG
jgi:hypothetical protein